MDASFLNDLVERFFSGKATVEERLEFFRRLLTGELEGSIQHPAMLLLTVSERERRQASKTKARTLQRILRGNGWSGASWFGVVTLMILFSERV